MSFLGAASALCAVLLVVDIVSRGVRLAAYIREAGGQLSLRDSLITTIIGDAAAAVTPWRIGGEPARIYTMRPGTSFVQSVIALGGESAVNYAVVILIGLWLGSQYGGLWWREIGRGLRPPMPNSPLAWAILLAIIAVILIAIFASRRVWRLLARVGSALRSSMESLLRAPGRLLAIGLVLSVVSLAARIAMLPILAASTPNHPGLGVLAFVSFSLLYGQLLVPSPSGLGAMDALVLAGGTGVHTGTGELLGLWRLYSTILPTVIGIVVTVAHFGPGTWRAISGRDSGEITS